MVGHTGKYEPAVRACAATGQWSLHRGKVTLIVMILTIIIIRIIIIIIITLDVNNSNKK